MPFSVSASTEVEIDLIHKGIKTRLHFVISVASSNRVEIDLIIKGIKTKRRRSLAYVPLHVETDLTHKGIKTREET